MVLLVGCGIDNTVYIDSSFTSDEVTMIYMAVDEWNEATDSKEDQIDILGFKNISGEFSADKWNNMNGIIFKVHSSEKGYEEIKTKEAPGDYVGKYNTAQNNIILVTDKLETSTRFYGTILHEFGHMLGLLEHGPGIMNDSWNVDDGACIHQTDIDRYCAEFECGKNAHNTCGT